MVGDQLAAMKGEQAIALALQLDTLPDQPEGHRIAVSGKAHQPVACDDATHARSQPKAGLTGARNQRNALALEASDRGLVGGAVYPAIGYRGVPFVELLLHVDDVDELTPGQEIALDVLHPRFNLALGLGTVSPAHVRIEAPVLGKGMERRIPNALARLVGIAHRARPIVQVLAGVAAEVLEGALMGFQKLAHALVGALP